MIWSVPGDHRGARHLVRARARRPRLHRHARGRRPPRARRPRARRRGRRRRSSSIRWRRHEALFLLAQFRGLARAHRALPQGHPARHRARAPRARRRPAAQRVLPRGEPAGTGARARGRGPGVRAVARDHRVPRGDAPGAAAPAGGLRRPRDRAADGARSSPARCIRCRTSACWTTCAGRSARATPRWRNGCATGSARDSPPLEELARRHGDGVHHLYGGAVTMADLCLVPHDVQRAALSSGPEAVPGAGRDRLRT